MLFYSVALSFVLLVSMPLWGWRMLRQGRYREGLRERLGAVPQRLRQFVEGRKVIWVHAVSVGEVLASVRLVRALEEALPEYRIVISTTTPTGQKVARARFGADRVFFYPLDFAFAVRTYLQVLRPHLLVLMESELWPRMLTECKCAGVPVAVVNARVSDRSLPRYRALRLLWRPLLAKVRLLLAQSETDAERWVGIGAPADRVRISGNLKYDIAVDPDSPLALLVRRRLPINARVLVAGSTHVLEEILVLQAYAEAAGKANSPTVLVLAPRHPSRSEEVIRLVLDLGLKPVPLSRWRMLASAIPDRSVLVVDTVGELAPLYSLASGAFIGGSLIARGGHNPLEAAQFGVPVAMGPHYENFRTMVDAMRAQDAVAILDCDGLVAWFSHALSGGIAASGERARIFYESQSGATDRTLQALLPLLQEGRGA